MERKEKWSDGRHSGFQSSEGWGAGEGEDKASKEAEKGQWERGESQDVCSPEAKGRKCFQERRTVLSAAVTSAKKRAERQLRFRYLEVTVTLVRAGTGKRGAQA